MLEDELKPVRMEMHFKDLEEIYAKLMLQAHMLSCWLLFSQSGESHGYFHETLHNPHLDFPDKK